MVLLSVTVNLEVKAQGIMGLTVDTETRRDGFDIYSVSGATGYSSYPGTFIAGNNTGGTQAGYSSLASLSTGFYHGGAKLKFASRYTPSYAGTYYSSSLNSFNQSLSLEMIARISSKWAYSLSISGDDVTVDQFLFRQNGLSQLVSGPASIDDFAATVISGAATRLSASPQTLVYGTRILSFGFNSGLSFKPSTRLSVNFTGGATRSISRTPANGLSQSVIPRSTVEHAGIGISFSKSPRTEIGAQTEATLTNSPLGDFRSFSYTGTYGRKLGAHWFSSVQAGLSNYQFVNTRTSLPSGASVVASGTIGYKDRGSAWAVTYNRMAGDLYGLASSSSSSFFGTWDWRKPGSKWGIQSFGGQQRLLGGPTGGISIWHGSAGLSRAVSRQASVSLAYGYMSDIVAPVLAIQTGVAHSMRLTVFWIPRHHPLELPGKDDFRSAYETVGENPKTSLFSFQPIDTDSTTSDLFRFGK